MIRIRELIILSVLLAFTCSGGRSGMASEMADTDLIVPLQSAPPRLRFHAGGIGPDAKPSLLSTLPGIPGPVSSWYVAQWQQASYLLPDAMHTLDAGGRRSWSFMTPDRHSSLLLHPLHGGHAYTLYERDGLLTEGGGANLFLATNSLPVATNFSSPIELSIRTRVTHAEISYDTVEASGSGAVLAMAFVGLGLMFRDPSAHAGDRFVFMQLPIVGSMSRHPGPGIMCTLAGDEPKLLYAPEADPVAFRPDAADRERRYDLTGLVKEMTAEPYPCGGRIMGWPAVQRDPAHWHLTGLYVGLETQNRDGRRGAEARPQGHAALGLDISALSIRRR